MRRTIRSCGSSSADGTRGFDLVDLERLVAVRPELDGAHVRCAIVDMMGDDDERTRAWDQIVGRFG